MYFYLFGRLLAVIKQIAFQINVNSNQYQTKEMEQISNLNYFYDYFPYFIAPPALFPIETHYHSSFIDKSHPQVEYKTFEQNNQNLKIQEPQPTYIEAKQQPEEQHSKTSRKKRSDSKKIQTDSFTQKRNIIPNNINHILAFLQRKSKSQRYVKMLINKHGGMASYSPKRFFCYQQHLKQKLHVHVNKESLTKLVNHLDQCSLIFPVEEQKFYNRISRILIYFYLREIAKITILSSGRVKQTNKKDHLAAQRELIHHIANIDYDP